MSHTDDERTRPTSAGVGRPDAGEPVIASRGVVSGVGAAEAPALPLPATAAELVTRLWQTSPPMVWTPGRSAATERTDVLPTLAGLARSADALTTSGDPEERRAAALLAETARAIGVVLGTQTTVTAPSSTTTDGSSDAEGLPSPVRLRLARMESWLAARAQTDRAVEPSATLCLWLLEHLEIEIP